MKIIKLHIDNFGKFNNYDLSFKRGINLIYGDNESGKTTIMTFIMMMFYGSNNRKKDLLDNPRKKYRPWNNQKMKGSIIFEFKKRYYRLDRTFNETNNKDQVSLIDNVSGENVQIPNIQQPGNYFFNMTYETFKKSLYIDSEDLIVLENDSSEIKEKLLNLISTSDEDVSYDKTKEKLLSKLYELKSKSGKKGVIVELQNDIEQFYKSLKIAEDEEIEKKEIEEKLKRYEDDIDLEKLDIELEKTNFLINKAQQNQSINERRKALEKELKELSKERNEIYNSLDEINYIYHENLYKKESISHQKDKLLLEKAALSQLLEKSKSQENTLNFKLLSQVMISLIFISLIVVFVTYVKYGLKNWFFISLAIFVGILLLKVLYTDNYKKKGLERANSLQINSSKYDNIFEEIINIEKVQKQLEEKIYENRLKIKDYEHKLDLFEADVNNKNKELEDLKDKDILQSLDPRILEKANEDYSNLKAVYDQKLKKYIAKYKERIISNHVESDNLLMLNKEYERLKGYASERFRNSRYPDQIKSKIYELKKQLEEKNKLYKSIEKAIEILDLSYKELSNDFKPILNEESQSIFNKFSANKYEKLLISDDFDIKFEDNIDKNIKNWRYLSSGARDQIYISLRLALAKLLVRDDKKPLLLDDIFIKFDEYRAKKSIEFLYKLEEDFEQIILFTCHKRIYEFAKDDAIILKDTKN